MWRLYGKKDIKGKVWKWTTKTLWYHHSINKLGRKLKLRLQNQSRVLQKHQNKSNPVRSVTAQESDSLMNIYMYNTNTWSYVVLLRFWHIHICIVSSDRNTISQTDFAFLTIEIKTSVWNNTQKHVKRIISTSSLIKVDCIWYNYGDVLQKTSFPNLKRLTHRQGQLEQHVGVPWYLLLNESVAASSWHIYLDQCELLCLKVIHKKTPNFYVKQWAIKI